MQDAELMSFGTTGNQNIAKGLSNGILDLQAGRF